ncbi:MAG: alpha/beta hydrolase [Sphingomonas sp.]
MSGPFVNLPGGHQLFVRDWGSGKPVLLLAGWAMDSRIWYEIMLALNAAGLRTIAYDRRGHGRSTDLGGFDYDSLADDLAAVLAALDLNDVTLVAHSGAGGEAIRYASRHGASRIARIVLVGATGPKMSSGPDHPAGATPAMFDALSAQLATDLSGWIDQNIEPFAPGTSTCINEWMATMVLDCSRRAIVDFQRTIVQTDLTAEAAELDLPVTIIHGDRDVSAPIDLTARRYATLIQNAELIIYEGVAHGVMVTDTVRLARDIIALADVG